MENNKQFTNEELAGKFKNNFDLVNYAISLAENMIQSGRDPRVRRGDVQNRAMLILEEIREGKDIFDEIPEEGLKPQNSQRNENSYEAREPREPREHREREPREQRERKEKARSFQDAFEDDSE